MRNKLLLWSFVFLFLVTLVNASLLTDNIFYLSHDDANMTGMVETNWAPGISAATHTATQSNTGVINESRSYSTNSTVSIVSTGHNSIFDVDTSDFSVAFWYNPNDVDTNGQYIVTNRDTSMGSDDKFWALNQNNKIIQFSIYTATCVGGSNNVVTWHSNSTGGWVHVAAMKDGDNMTLYVNNVLVNTTDASISTEPSECTSAGILVGGTNFSGSVGGTFNGSIDEVGVWNYSLSSVDVNNLYFHYQYPFVSGIVNNFTITAVDEWNATPIIWFSAEVNGINYSSNSTGHIEVDILHNNTNPYNVTIFNTSNYYDRTYINYVVHSSGNLQARLHESEVCFNNTKYLTNVSLLNENFYIGTTTSIYCFNISAGTHTVTSELTNYFNQTQDFTIASQEILNVTVNDLYSSVVNITLSYPNGTTINTYDINVSQDDYNFLRSGSTTNGSYVLHAINETYTATVNAASFPVQTFQFLINTTVQNVTLKVFDVDNCSVYTLPFLNFTLRNEADDALLVGNLGVFFNFTADSIYGYVNETFTLTGASSYSFCAPANSTTNFTVNAQAEYEATGYNTKLYYLTNAELSIYEIETINLFLTANTTLVTLNVKDYNDDPVSDVIIKVLSYDLASNTYTTTEILQSDSYGEAIANMVLNTEWYAFILEYNGNVILQTLPQKITATTLNFRVDLLDDYFTQYTTARDIESSLTFTNSTLTFSFSWSDTSGAMQEACLSIVRRGTAADVEINETCVTSTAGNIVISIVESVSDYTYVGTAYVIYPDDTEFILDTLSVSFDRTIEKFGSEGLYITFFVVLTLMMIGIWSPVISIVLTTVAVVASVIMGIFYISWTALIVLIILGGIAIYRLNKP